MSALLAVAIITLLAVISPGADFAMVTRNSCLYGRRAGLLAALGIALGVLVHVGYTLLGVGLLIARALWLLGLLRLVGAAYLIYIGWRTFAARPVSGDASSRAGVLSAGAALRSGFLTNALNPKTTLFVLSTFTQVVRLDTPLAVQLGYGLFIAGAHAAWFALVALFFSQPGLRDALLRGQLWLNRAIGTVLVGLGVTLAVVPL